MPGLLPTLLIAAASPTQGLDVFDRLVGRCWEGRIPANALDVHCFEPFYGGAHVRDRHRVLVEGKVVYEGETIYSREDGTIAFTYWNALGGVGHGNAAPDANGICFSGSMRGTPDDALQPLATCWRWEGSGYQMIDGDKPPVQFTLSDKHF
jgi:hypothetical protein